MSKVSDLTKKLSKKNSLYWSLQKEINFLKNDILVCTSEWEKVDIRIWNPLLHKYELMFCYRFANSTNKPQNLDFNWMKEFLESEFYKEFVENAVSGTDYVDVGW